jgi:hypothetical protein
LQSSSAGCYVGEIFTHCALRGMHPLKDTLAELADGERRDLAAARIREFCAKPHGYWIRQVFG